MLSPQAKSVRVAVFATDPEQAQRLSAALRRGGLEVALQETQYDVFLGRLNDARVDVLLVDVDENTDDALVDRVLEQTTLPILFNDSSVAPMAAAATAEVSKKLVHKLLALTMAKVPSVAAPAAMLATAAAQPAPLKPTAPTAENPEAARNVWVLGASLGGPQAVRQFLEAVSPEIPVAFVLAQHIGANHVELLASQLNRVTPLQVVAASEGLMLRHAQVVTAPADARLTISEQGRVALRPIDKPCLYSPSIDSVMAEVAARYGARAGTIVFSGMGDDGAKGCLDIARRGGVVWAQNSESCVVSSMPDCARQSGAVTFSGAPKRLAKHLSEFYRKSS